MTKVKYGKDGKVIPLKVKDFWPSIATIIAAAVWIFFI